MLGEKTFHALRLERLFFPASVTLDVKLTLAKTVRVAKKREKTATTCPRLF